MNFFKKNKFFFLGILVLFIVILVNRFPQGYVFAGGDTIQLISAKTNWQNLFFDWEGRASLFYLIFYLLDSAGVNDTAQLSFYLGMFLIGSYISFFIFSKLIFRSSDLVTTLVSLFYSLNLFTLFVFTGNWGFSYLLSLYIFIPVLIGLLIRFLHNGGIKFGIWFILILFFGSSGFGNPAFALSFSIFSTLLILTLLLFKVLIWDKKIFIRLMLVVGLSLLVNFYWIIGIVPQMREGVAELNASTVINLEEVLRKNSNPMEKTLSLNHFSEKYFPYQFYYKNWKGFRGLFLVISFLPILIGVFGIFMARRFKRSQSALFFSFFTTLLFFVVLVAKIRPPFEVINEFIYHAWGLGTLRGVEKTTIFIPFLLASLLLIIGHNLRSRKWFYVAMIFVLLIPLPFFVGKLQQTAGYRVSTNRDYTRASNSFLLKIPEEYYEIRSVINDDPEKVFIATLPMSRNDGSGIVHYPGWSLFGADITQHLYNKELIEANRPVFKDWNYAEEFGESGAETDWIVQLLGVMNAKYILYHKDATEKHVLATIEKMELLEKNGLLKNLEENEYFVLYEINRDYIFPYVSLQKKRFDIVGSSSSISENFDGVRASVTAVAFLEKNPKKYVVSLEKAGHGNLILAETYDPLWRAYAVSEDGSKERIEKHFKARGYANGWELTEHKGASEIVVEYYPIKLLWKGLFVSLATLIFLGGWLIYLYLKKNVKNRKTSLK